MKKNKNELDVDYIGGQTPLTKDEENAISEFIRTQKAKRERHQLKLKARISRKQETASV